MFLFGADNGSPQIADRETKSGDGHERSTETGASGVNDDFGSSFGDGFAFALERLSVAAAKGTRRGSDYASDVISFLSNEPAQKILPDKNSNGN